MFFSENLCGYGPTRWSDSCVGPHKPFGSVDQRNYHGDWHNSYTCKGASASTSQYNRVLEY